MCACVRVYMCLCPCVIVSIRVCVCVYVGVSHPDYRCEELYYSQEARQRWRGALWDSCVGPGRTADLYRPLRGNG